MNKEQLVRRLAEETNTTQKQAKQFLDAFVDIVSDALQSEDRVFIVDFGVFKVKERKPKIGRNPRTGEEVKIPARKAVVFTPAKALKDKVNG